VSQAAYGPAVSHIFMIYVPLFCGTPEGLQGYSLPYPRQFTLGCEGTRTLKHR